MKLTYIFHSGFAIEDDEFIILIDFYKDLKGGFKEHFLNFKGKLYILSSHSHGDHFASEVMEWQKERPDIIYILSDDIRTEFQIKPSSQVIFLNKGEQWNNEQISIKAFGSTDIGISFLIYVEDKSIFHAGDLNNWHWSEESTPEEIEEAESNYLHELNGLALETSHINLVMFPVDPRIGKDYMRGAEQFSDKIDADVFVPMHFWKKYEAASAFKTHAESRGAKFISWNHPGECVNIYL